MVSKPQVITRTEDDKILEPVERLFLDIPEEFIGVLTEKTRRHERGGWSTWSTRGAAG